MNKRITLSAMLKNWLAVYLGNFIGSILFAWLMYVSQLWGQGGELTAIGEKQWLQTP